MDIFNDKLNKNRLIKFIILFIIIFITYFPILFNEFTLDDKVIFYNISQDKDFFYFFKFPILHGDILVYRPITFIAFYCDNILWNKSPIGFHFTNILLHFLCVSIFFFLIKNLLILFYDKNSIDKEIYNKINSISFLSSIIFGIYPGISETIINIYNRSQIISTIFIFLTIIFFIDIVRTKKINRLKLFLASLFTFFSCLSKESGIVTPLLSCLILIFFVSYKKEKKLFIHLLGGILLQILMIFIYIKIRYNITHSIVMKGVEPFLKNRSLFSIYFNLSFFYSKYIILSFFPINLSCDYPLKPINFSFFGVLLLFILFITLYFLFCLQKNSKKNIFYSLSVFTFYWTFFCLLPVLHIFPIQIAFAERLLYPAYPIIAFFLSYIMIFYLKNKYKRILIYFYIITLIIGTFKRCFDWKNNKTLWESVYKIYPNSYRALIFKGNFSFLKKDYKKALFYYNLALKFNPNSYNKLLIYYNKSLTYYKLKKYKLSIKNLQNIIKIKKDYYNAWCLLGDIYFNINKIFIALRYYYNAYKYALKYRIYNSNPLANILIKIGVCYLKLNDKNLAKNILKKALKFKNISFYKKRYIINLLKKDYKRKN